MPRIEDQTEVKRRGRENIKASPGLLFGSDHPWVTVETIMRHFNSLAISEEDKAKILGLNACRLFRIR